MNITFKQNDTTLDINVKGNTINANKVYGTALNELFHIVNLQSEVGAKFFKLNEPILISVTSGKFAIDSSSAHVKLQQKLKLNKTAKSKRQFAKRLVLICNEVLRAREVVNVNDLLKSLED